MRKVLLVLKWDTVKCVGRFESREWKLKSQEREDINEGDKPLRFPKQRTRTLSSSETAEMRIKAETNPTPHSKT